MIAYDEVLENRILAKIEEWKTVSAKKMFGHSFFVSLTFLQAWRCNK